MSAAPLPPFPASGASTRPERPLRVALVGAGVMGKRHARVLASRRERFQLVAVVDVDARAAAALAREHGVEVASREAEAIERADALVIATPAVAHAQTARRALASGRHVLVEKPIAVSALEAAQLVELAELTGAGLFVGHTERFNPVVRALVRLVEPSTIESIALQRFGNARPACGGEGALVNLGVHDFDLAAYIARSTITPTNATTEPGPGGEEERAEVVARTESGARIDIAVDQRPADCLRRRTIVVSTARHVWRGDLLVPSLVRACRTTGVLESVPLGTEEPLLAQALAFLGAVRGVGSSGIATGHDGMRALLVAERARRAPPPGPPWGKLGVSPAF